MVCRDAVVLSMFLEMGAYPLGAILSPQGVFPGAGKLFVKRIGHGVWFEIVVAGQLGESDSKLLRAQR
jgi:hypothetical protein